VAVVAGVVAYPLSFGPACRLAHLGVLPKWVITEGYVPMTVGLYFGPQPVRRVLGFTFLSVSSAVTMRPEHRTSNVERRMRAATCGFWNLAPLGLWRVIALQPRASLCSPWAFESRPVGALAQSAAEDFAAQRRGR
jgi:hypothetical protein